MLCDQRRGADIHILDHCCPKAGRFYLLDSDTWTFARLYVLKQGCAFFNHARPTDTQFGGRYGRTGAPGHGSAIRSAIQLTRRQKPRACTPDPAAPHPFYLFHAQKDLRDFSDLTIACSPHSPCNLTRAPARWPCGVVFFAGANNSAYQCFFSTLSEKTLKTPVLGGHPVYVLGGIVKQSPLDLKSLQNPADSSASR